MFHRNDEHGPLFFSFISFLLSFQPSHEGGNHTKLVFLEWSNLWLETNQMDGLSLLPNPGGQEFSKCIGVIASDKVKEAIFLIMTI